MSHALSLALCAKDNEIDSCPKFAHRMFIKKDKRKQMTKICQVKAMVEIYLCTFRRFKKNQKGL